MKNMEELQAKVDEVDRVVHGLLRADVSFEVISEYLEEETSQLPQPIIWRMFVLSVISRIKDRIEDDQA